MSMAFQRCFAAIIFTLFFLVTKHRKPWDHLTKNYSFPLFLSMVMHMEKHILIPFFFPRCGFPNILIEYCDPSFELIR